MDHLDALGCAHVEVRADECKGGFLIFILKKYTSILKYCTISEHNLISGLSAVSCKGLEFCGISL